MLVQEMHLLMGGFELGGKLEMCGAYEGILIGIYNYFNVFLDGPPDDTTADALEVFFSQTLTWVKRMC